jgi:hypothetical protein
MRSYTAAIWGAIAGVIFAVLHSLPERRSVAVAAIIFALVIIGATARVIQKKFSAH